MKIVTLPLRYPNYLLYAFRSHMDGKRNYSATLHFQENRVTHRGKREKKKLSENEQSKMSSLSCCKFNHRVFIGYVTGVDNTYMQKR